MSELQKLQEKHVAEIKALQDSCSHDERSEWMDHWWAPGHSSGYCVKLCNRCGKTLEQKSHMRIPLKERPFFALPTDARTVILKLSNEEKLSLEDAQKKYFDSESVKPK